MVWSLLEPVIKIILLKVRLSLVPRHSLLICCPREAWERASLGGVTAHGRVQEWPSRKRLEIRLGSPHVIESEFWNPGNFFSAESGIQLKESWIQVPLTKNLVPGIRNPLLEIQNPSLYWILLHGMNWCKQPWTSPTNLAHHTFVPIYFLPHQFQARLRLLGDFHSVNLANATITQCTKFKHISESFFGRESRGNYKRRQNCWDIVLK